MKGDAQFTTPAKCCFSPLILDNGHARRSCRRFKIFQKSFWFKTGRHIIMKCLLSEMGSLKIYPIMLSVKSFDGSHSFLNHAKNISKADQVFGNMNTQNWPVQYILGKQTLLFSRFLRALILVQTVKGCLVKMNTHAPDCYKTFASSQRLLSQRSCCCQWRLFYTSLQRDQRIVCEKNRALGDNNLSHY